MASDSDDIDETGDATAVIDTQMLRQGDDEGETQSACITVMAGPQVGQVVTLEDEPLTIGRDPDCDVHLTDRAVSRFHARIYRRSGEVFVEDLQSSNGTVVNEKEVDGERMLRDGDRIGIGGATLIKFAYQDEVEQTFQRKMYEASLRDALTGAYNKEYLLDHLDSELSYANRHGDEISLVMFDLDHFKQINDVHGHLAGDAILREVADLTRESIRDEDKFVRYGGEEFSVVLRNIGPGGARAMAERLRRTIDEFDFVFEGTTIDVTISVGIASRQHVLPERPEDLIAAADEALYEAKETGRNRVCYYE